MESRVIHSVEELAVLQTVWRLHTVNEPNPFATYDWNVAVARHFLPPGTHLEVIAFSVAESVRAIFPLTRTGHRLDFLGSDLCDFQDAIADDEGDLAESLEVLLEGVRDRTIELDLTKVSERCRLFPHLAALGRSEGISFESEPHGPCPWTAVEGDDYDSIVAQFPGKATRKHLRRSLRKLKHDLCAELKVIEGFDREFYEDASRLHLGLQESKKRDSLFSRRGFPDFLEEIGKSPDIGLIGFALVAGDGSLLAFESGFERLGTYSSWIGAYDMEFADYRAGTTLQVLAMEALKKRGTGVYDFLCGGELYKFHYASDEYRVHSFRLRGKTLLAETAAGLRRFERRLRPGVKRCLQQAGVYRTGYRIDELV